MIIIGVRGPLRRNEEYGKKGKMYIKSVKEMDVYKLAYEQAMDIFEISKRFPKDERLTNRNVRAGQMSGNILNKTETFCIK